MLIFFSSGFELTATFRSVKLSFHYTKRWFRSTKKHLKGTNSMKITDIKITPVTVPMDATLRWCMGTESGTTRGIVQVYTDEGIVGIGETYGGNAVEHAIEIAKPLVVGLDPLEIGVLMHKLN